MTEAPRLRVELPPGRPAERRYVCEVVLGEFLGIPFDLAAAQRSDVRITCPGDPEGRELLLADVLLAVEPARWLQPDSLPVRPLRRWAAADEGIDALLADAELPVLYGAPAASGRFSEVGQRRAAVGVDLLGSIFFMLTRYEELVVRERDRHDRMPAAAGLPATEGALDRPLVNEYVEALWAILRRLWPALRRRERRFRLLVSHDVDWPYCTFGRGLGTAARGCAGDLWHRRSPRLAGRRLVSFARTRGSNPDADLCNTFDLLMDLSERHGVRSAFYFIAGHTAGEVDGIYRLSDPSIESLLKRIHERGHEIGLHPSYHTYRDGGQLAREYAALREAAAAAGIVQDEWGGRQHVLRWEAPTTWEHWEAAGLDYDSTLGFADRPGFRCGTCWEYPVFSLRTGTPLRLRERPLIVMDVSLVERRYLNLSPEAALETGCRLLERCRRFRGDFTLLWHNSQLLLPAHLAIYRRLLEQGAGGS